MNTPDKVLNSLLSSKWNYRMDAREVRQAYVSGSLGVDHGGWLKQNLACHVAGLPNQTSDVVTGVSAVGELGGLLVSLVEGVRARAKAEDLQDYGEYLENQAVAAAVASLMDYAPEQGPLQAHVARAVAEALRTGVNRAKSLQVVRDSLTGATEIVKAQAAAALQGLTVEPGQGVADSAVNAAITAYVNGLEPDDREILACYLGADAGRPCSPEETSRLTQVPVADVRRRYQQVIAGLQSALTRLGLKFLSGDTPKMAAYASSVVANCKALASYEPVLFRSKLDLSTSTRRGAIVWTTPFESADDICLRTAAGEELTFSKTAGNRFSSAEGEKGFFDVFEPVNDVEIEAYYDARRNISQYQWNYLGKDVFHCVTPGRDEEHVHANDVYQHLADNFGFEDVKFGEQISGGFVTSFVYDALENDVKDVVYNELYRQVGDKTKTLPAEHGEIFEDLGAERHDARSHQVRDNREKAAEGRA